MILLTILTMITSCMAAQGSVNDDFSSKGKMAVCDCSPDPNPVTGLGINLIYWETVRDRVTFTKEHN